MRWEGRASRDVAAAGVARSLMSRLDRTGEGFERAKAVTAWRDAAGPEVAAHARGFALREGELLVFVDSSVWANELSALSEHYRTAVNERIGKETVRAVRFTVSKAVAQERWWEAAESRSADERDAERVQPVAATETERGQIRMMASAIHDEKVREAVIAAAICDLEWRKGIEARNAAQRAPQRATGPDSDAGPRRS
jgi:hypothetical protein